MGTCRAAAALCTRVFLVSLLTVPSVALLIYLRETYPFHGFGSEVYGWKYHLATLAFGRGAWHLFDSRGFSDVVKEAMGGQNHLQEKSRMFIISSFSRSAHIRGTLSFS